MTNRKQEWRKFFLWLRNGFCFVTTWFLFLLWVFLKQSGRVMMLTDCIPAVMLGSAGAVVIFCAVFTKVFIRKFGFAVRFTLFLALTVLYELAYGQAAYHWLSGQEIPPLRFGFAESGEWLGFAGVVLLMYASSMGIYAVYRKKKGALYTEALRHYQEQSAS